MQSLAEIIDAYNPEAPLAQASTIPASWYVDPRILDLERRTVFASSWQLAGRVDQVIHAGDYLSSELPGGEPVVVVRGADEVLRGFFNVCRHHAAEVVTEPQGSAHTLRCPYHGWTYSLDGALKGTPDFAGVCDFDRAANGLVPIAAEVWEKWVFVRVNQAGSSLAAFLGASLLDQVRTLRLDDLHWMERRRYLLDCNWKVFIDNYLDGGYHIPHLHKGLDSVLDYSNYTIENGDRFCLQSSPMVAEGAEPATGAVRTGDRSLYYWIYPNFMINCYEGAMDINLVKPCGIDRTEVIFDFYFSDVSEAARQRNGASIDIGDRIQKEDVSICASVQRGLRSRAVHSRSPVRAPRSGRASVSPAALRGSQIRHTSLTNSSFAAPRARLLRVLGVGFGVAVAVGNTIGAGILRAPGEVAEQLPHSGFFLAVWVIGALYALLGAAQIAELGAMIPRSGGQYVFSRYALGEYAGFVVGWSDWISTCGTTAAVSIVAAEFAAVLFPGLVGRRPALAAIVAVAFAVIQWRGIRWGRLVQNVTSAIKAIAFVALSAGAFLLGSYAGGAGPGGSLMPTGFALLTAFLLSLQAVIYTFDGWTGVVYFSEEVDNPGLNVPRALFAGVLSISAIYLLMNLSLLYLLPTSAIAGQPFAAGALAEMAFGRHGSAVFTVVVILSMLSAINAYHLMASRVLFAMSRDGLVSPKAAPVNAGGTPTRALLLSAMVSVLFIAFGRTFENVITVLAFFFVANYTLSFVSVFVLRRREPEKARPYKAWGYPWSTAVALVGSLAFLLGAVAGDTRNSAIALLVLAASYPVFRVMKSWAR